MLHCGVCKKACGTDASLINHGYTDHKGVDRSEWQVGWTRKRPGYQRRTAPMREISARTYEHILKEKPPTDAEKLVGLPWVRYPSTVEACTAVADDCLALAEKNRGNDERRSYWLSMREYIIAYGDRLQHLSAA